jgi:peptidoglycan/LPS O-acetylase OafA/YrhL
MSALGLVTPEQQESKNHLFQRFTHPWHVWQGGTSYVLFLIHNMIIRVWDTIISITLIQTPLIFALVVIAAALGYQYWENLYWLSYTARPSNATFTRLGIQHPIDMGIMLQDDIE